MESNTFLILYVASGILIIILIILICNYMTNPFDPPVIEITIDISRKKLPSYQDLIEQYLIDNRDFDALLKYNSTMRDWENECTSILNSHVLWKKHKYNQYQQLKTEANDKDYAIFQWNFVRNYTKHDLDDYDEQSSYIEENLEHTEELTLTEMLNYHDRLSQLNYETTSLKYHSKNQRKLMTKDLRLQIMNRDNYTCQSCGKYMPDEVGLHIDHIVSIKNGGKSVESNLQVLCDKCNLKKGSKMVN